ncbi:hypothetical protein EVAR_88277_1 [Eumeta japonica]|uniref:Uncharacterized protein n=1 Tax=Eumeta variegata TaxID=151549 RepID=A0A4C1XP21_EUMVA|nr:hypothetical protein EVAR_88277_1 [Eumeta japonica]
MRRSIEKYRCSSRAVVDSATSRQWTGSAAHVPPLAGCGCEVTASDVAFCPMSASSGSPLSSPSPGFQTDPDLLPLHLTLSLHQISYSYPKRPATPLGL